MEIEKRYSDPFDLSEIGNCKVFLFIGEFGAGKTELINSMCSYLMGITYQL